jgi:hypothetical protein
MVPTSLKKFALCTLGVWLVLGLGNGLITVITPLWAYVTIGIVFGAPVAGYILGVRRDMDLGQFGKFLVLVVGFTLIPYALFQTVGPFADSTEVVLLVRLSVFLVILGVAYSLTYRRRPQAPETA